MSSLSAADSGTGTPPPQPHLVVLLSDDILFPSRVRESLRPTGHALLVVTTSDALSAAAKAERQPAAILVNLTARRYDPAACIAMLKGDPATSGIPILAFAGHMEKVKHVAARRAGADMIAANSSISVHLNSLLARLLSGDCATIAGDIEDAAPAG